MKIGRIRLRQVFADRMNHNFFNRSWGLDEGPGGQHKVSLDVTSRRQHEELAKAYIMAFLLDSFHGRQEYREYLHRDTSYLKPHSVTAPPETISIQGLPPRAKIQSVDEYDGDSASNTLGGAVVGSNVSFQDIRLPVSRFYRQDTFGGVLDLNMASGSSPVYLSQTNHSQAGLDISGFRFVSMRLSQEHRNVSISGPNLDYSVVITDVHGQRSFVDVGSFGFTVNYSYQRREKTGTPPGDDRLNKSHFKTIRTPISTFTSEGRCIDTRAIVDVRLAFDKATSSTIQNALGIDDLVFEK